MISNDVKMPWFTCIHDFLLFLQMETKLRELQEKLAIEEADKLNLQTQLHQCLESEVRISFFWNSYQICLQNDIVFQEILQLRQKVEEETQLRQELDQKVVKMNQLLTTGQEALAQEKKTVELLKQQMASSSPQTPIKVSSIIQTL